MIHGEVTTQDPWSALVDALEFMADIKDYGWTVQLDTPQWEFGPYVQACYLDELDEYVGEITSNAYMRPSLSEHGEHKLRFLGWIPPQDSDYPNWYRPYPNTPEGKREIAKLWVQTLVEVFEIPLQSVFNVAPLRRSHIDEWRKHAFDFYQVSHFRLVDRFGNTRQQCRLLDKALSEREQQELHREVKSFVSKYPGASGATWIALGQQFASPAVVHELKRLLYTPEGVREYGYWPSTCEQYGFYRDFDFDERAGKEYEEEHSVFPEGTS
jgi:hypothetical protein